ncbi:hypothetical protein GA0074692_3436 [Micromonospora pallida]|uniref:HNH endonuclease n=1 Tax=Micromonospora pallida TaxID=145854 RepID=A0A1C6SU43_9ACTN|nr:HNH endonuclease [Micromonospora pallida]SCL32889.1 hypothetical protein GA0074692_3436 [Micromonospora pallida]
MTHKPPESLSIELPGGEMIQMLPPPGNGDPTKVNVVEALNPHVFDHCPVCAAPATSDEHLPPSSLGGIVMTRTCNPCNNKFGGYVEADLLHWFTWIIPAPRFRSENVPGARKSGRIAYRETSNGRFILLIDGKSDPSLEEMLRSGEVDLNGLLPDRNRYRLALLKQAYLGMCIALKGIPRGAISDQVRRDLIATRDAPSRQEVPTSALALGQFVRRFNQPQTDAPAALAVYSDNGRELSGVILVGRIFVAWEFRDALKSEPAGTNAIQGHLRVGKPVQGTVISVGD